MFPAQLRDEPRGFTEREGQRGFVIRLVVGQGGIAGNGGAILDFEQQRLVPAAVGEEPQLLPPDAEPLLEQGRRQFGGIAESLRAECVQAALAIFAEARQLAQTAPDPPSTYTIPTADDLSKIRSGSTILTIIGDLSGGGDKAKLTWLATCGSELPGVSGKVIDVQTGDGVVDFMVNTADTPEAMQAATTANMDVKVYTAVPANPPAAPAGATPPQIKPQPDVARLQKDDPISWSGTIVSYDPSPFVLHWDDVTVDPASIPAPGKPAARGRGAARGTTK